MSMIKTLESVLADGNEQDKNTCIGLAITYIEGLQGQRDRLMKLNETYKKGYDLAIALEECGVYN